MLLSPTASQTLALPKSVSRELPDRDSSGCSVLNSPKLCGANHSTENPIEIERERAKPHSAVSARKSHYSCEIRQGRYNVFGIGCFRSHNLRLDFFFFLHFEKKK